MTYKDREKEYQYHSDWSRRKYARLASIYEERVRAGDKQECLRCGEEKLVSEFPKHRNDCCRKCSNAEVRTRRASDPLRRSASARKLTYGITSEQYEKMIEDQGGVCAICGNPETAVFKKGGKRKLLGVDHDHDTHHNRDLLCGRCNPGIGLFREDTKILQKAIEYLQRWGK